MKLDKRHIAVLLVLTLTCCHRAGAGATDEVSPETDQPFFQVAASYDRHLTPENVQLVLRNRAGEYICVPLAETRIGSGHMDLLPDDETQASNRPPADMLAGLDVSEGVYVIPPGKRKDIFVNIDIPRSIAARELRGVLRAARCKDLFGGAAVQVQGAQFSVTL